MATRWCLYKSRSRWNLDSSGRIRFYPEPTRNSMPSSGLSHFLVPNVECSYRTQAVASTDCLYLDQFHRRPTRFSFAAKLWDVKPILPQACNVSSGFQLFLVIPCSTTREHIFPLVQCFLRNCSLKSFIFLLFWNSSPKSFICSSGSLWVEVLGTPAYFQLLPDGDLLCACGVFAEILRMAPQGGHNWGSQPSRLGQFS